MKNEASNFVVNTGGVYAIFLFLGLSKDQKDTLSDAFGGQIGLANWVSEFAPIVNTFVENDPRAYPGCFAYEIVEDMGTWLGNKPDATALEFECELKRRTDEWITKAVPAGEPA